jgi:hypothetical protein
MECFADTLELYDALRKCNVPEHTWAGWQRYLFDHVEPGRFLKAVISNDLTEACIAADELNLPALKSYVRFMYNELPHRDYAGTPWGSADALKAWCAERAG